MSVFTDRSVNHNVLYHNLSNSRIVSQKRAQSRFAKNSPTHVPKRDSPVFDFDFVDLEKGFSGLLPGSRYGAWYKCSYIGVAAGWPA